MRREEFDIEKIVEIMQFQGVVSVEYYLDTQTGDIVAIPEEIFAAIEDGTEDSLRPSHRALIQVAREIYDGTGRFIMIPRLSQNDLYSVISDISSRVEDPETAQCLAQVLSYSDFVSGFEELCITHPEVSDLFNQILDEYTLKLAQMWLAEIGVKP